MMHFVTLNKNGAAVIRLASPSSRDEGDPYYCSRFSIAGFHEVALLTGSLSFDRLQVGPRSVLTTSVLWIALKVSSCRCKCISHKILWSSTYYAIVPNPADYVTTT